MHINEERSDWYWHRREQQNERSSIAVISNWSSMIIKIISRIANEQRVSLQCVSLKYLLWFKRWSSEHLWSQNLYSSSLCDFFGALLLCGISLKSEDRLELLCVRGSQWCMSIITTHWLHWDLHILWILPFDYYLLKSLLKPTILSVYSLPFQRLLFCFTLIQTLYFLVKQKIPI